MTYGRNFEFLVPPDAKSRHGRHIVPSTGSRIPIGAPVEYDLAHNPDSLGRQPLVLATSGGSLDVGGGLQGIMVFEHILYPGVDPVLTTWSDMDTAPLGAAVQMVVDPDVKVRFRNTVARTFLGARSYAGRVMVAGLGATPTLDVGDYLAPGAGNDTAGYWAAVNDVADGWLVVTGINLARAEVEARMLIN